MAIQIQEDVNLQKIKDLQISYNTFIAKNDKTIELPKGLVLTNWEIMQLAAAPGNSIKIFPILEDECVKLIIVSGDINEAGDDIKDDGGGEGTGPLVVYKPKGQQ